MRQKISARIIIDIASLLSIPRHTSFDHRFTSSDAARYFSELLALIQVKTSLELDQIDFILLTQTKHHQSRQFQKVFSDTLQELISYDALIGYLNLDPALKLFWENARVLPLISESHVIIGLENVVEDEAIPVLIWLGNQTKFPLDIPFHVQIFRASRAGDIWHDDLAVLERCLDSHTKSPYEEVHVYTDFDDSLCCNQLVSLTHNQDMAVNNVVAKTLLKIKASIELAKFKVLTSRPSLPKQMMQRFEMVTSLLDDLDLLDIKYSNQLRSDMKALQAKLQQILSSQLQLSEETNAMKLLYHDFCKTFQPKLLLKDVQLVDFPDKLSICESIANIENHQQSDIETLEFFAVADVCQKYEMMHDLKIEASNESHLTTCETQRYKAHHIVEAHQSADSRVLIILLDDNPKEIKLLKDLRKKLRNNIVVISLKVMREGELSKVAIDLVLDFIEDCNNTNSFGKSL